MIVIDKKSKWDEPAQSGHSRPDGYERASGAWRLAMACALLCTASLAGAAQLIGTFDSSRGRIKHFEEGTQGYFQVERESRRLNLPASWRQTNVERTFALANDNTAIVVSHSDEQCGARLALVVLAPGKAWGPYALGDCNEMLAYQRSADGGAFVAVRANNRQPQAWVYTAADAQFRGPARIALPDSLNRLAQAAPATGAAVMAPPPVLPPLAPVAGATVRQPEVGRPQAPPPSPVTQTSAGGQFTRDEASKVSADVVKTTAPQRRVSIDLT